MSGKKVTQGKPEPLLAVRSKQRYCNMCQKPFISTGLHSCNECTQTKSAWNLSKREAGARKAPTSTGQSGSERKGE